MLKSDKRPRRGDQPAAGVFACPAKTGNRTVLPSAPALCQKVAPWAWVPTNLLVINQPITRTKRVVN